VSLHPAVEAIAKRQQAVFKSLKSGSLPAAMGATLRENYAYQYKDNTLGMGRSGAAETGEADDSEKSIPFTISLYSEDRDGDIVYPPGCVLTNYSRNPVVFFGHQQWEIPIGVSRSQAGEVTIWPMEDRILAKWYADTEDEDAMFVYGKVKRGILSAASIAFVPIEAYRRDEVEKARPHNDRPHGMPMGWFFKSYDLTEWSIVGIPSNAGAIRDALDSEKSFISPRLQKGLSAYAANAKGCWGGWCPLPEKSASSLVSLYESSAGMSDSALTSALATVRSASKEDLKAALSQMGYRPPSSSQSGMASFLAEKITNRRGANMRATMVNRPKGAKMCDCNGKKKNTQADMEPGGKRPSINPPPGVRPKGKWQVGDKVTYNGQPAAIQEVKSDGTVVLFFINTGRTQQVAPVGISSRKGMNSDSGQAGGYLVDSGAVEANGKGGGRLSDTEADGYQACQSCNSTGNCDACGGGGEIDGEDCSTCHGSGSCPNCDGVGLIQKSIKSKGKPPMAEENEEKPDGATEEEDTPEETAETPEEPATPDLPEDDNPPIEAKDGVDEPFEPDPANPAVDKASASEPFNPKPSAKFAAALYGHYKAAMDYIENGLRDMDNPGMRQHMEGHKEFLSKAMEHVAAGLAEHHPDHDMDSLMKALEVDNTTGNDPNLQGESGMVTAGDVPPMNEGGAIPPQMGTQQAPDAMPNDVPEDPFAGQQTPDEEAQGMFPTPGIQEQGFAEEPQDQPGQEPYDKGPDMGDSGIPESDADTEEILERYRHPKNGKWMTRKHLIKKYFVKFLKLRIAKDGKKYLIKDLTDMGNPAELKPGNKKPKEGDGAYIEGSGHSQELDEGKKPAPYNKSLVDDVGAAGEFLADLSTDTVIPKTYRNVAKQHSTRLGSVQKQLTNAGKVQRNGGGGRALSQSGKVQSNSGEGETLSEAGKPQRDSRSRQQVVGSGTPQGVNDKRPPYNSSKAPQVKPVAKEVIEEFASFKRMFAQLTGKN